MPAGEGHMKKAKDSIRNKEIIALILIIVLFFLIRFALLYIGARLSETRENELIQLKMNALTDIVSDASEKRAAASERVNEKLAANTRLLTAIQRELSAEGGRIDEDAASVNAMREKEAAAFLDHYNEPIYEILESTDDSFGGVTLLVSKENGSLHIERQFGSLEGLEKLSDGELTADMLQPSAVLTLNEREYHCSAAALEEGGSGGENRYVVQLIPKVSLSDQNVSRALLIVLVMVIILAAVTVYVISAQRFTTDHGLSDERAAHYHPDNVRRRMVTVGILSVLVVFAVALLVESVGQLYMELRYGRDTLRLFTGQVQKESQEQIKSVSEEEASWYLWYGEELASVLAEHPELATAENLQEYCDLLQIDYLMLFDAKGNETACSRDYVGFTLGDSPEDAL